MSYFSFKGRQKSELGPISLSKWPTLLFILPQSSILPHWLLTAKAVKRDLMRDLNPKCKDQNTLDKSRYKRTSILVSGRKEYLVPAKPHLRRCVQRSLEALKCPHTVHRSATRTHHPLTAPLETSSAKYVVKVICDLSFNPIGGLFNHLILFVICTFGVMR